MKEFIKRFFQNRENKPIGKLPKKSKYLIVIGVTGLLLLIISNLFSNSSTPELTPKQTMGQKTPTTEQETEATFKEKKSATSNASELETSYEKQLKGLLENIEGVSEVEIMVNLDSTKIKVYEKNLVTGKQITDESDKSGGTREIEDYSKESEVVILRQGEKEVPLLIQTKKPEVRGVFIVAKGVDQAQVKKWVIEAVSKVLDVPTHRVSVMSKS